MNGEIKIGTLVQCLGGTPNPAHHKFAGTIHTVRERVFRGTNAEPAYFLEPPTDVNGMTFRDGRPFELSWSRKYLRILDNPSDDAVDQTLLWKPVPTTDEVTA